MDIQTKNNTDINLLKRKISVMIKAGVPVKIKWKTKSKEGDGILTDMYENDEFVFVIKDNKSGEEMLMSSKECQITLTPDGTVIESK